MSTKNENANKLDIKDVRIDFLSNLERLNYENWEKKTGLPAKTIGSISEELGVSRVIVKKWESKAPQILGMIAAYMKKYDLQFEDLVKEVDYTK